MRSVNRALPADPDGKGQYMPGFVMVIVQAMPHKQSPYDFHVARYKALPGQSKISLAE